MIEVFLSLSLCTLYEMYALKYVARTSPFNKCKENI